eukprot:58389_1
MQQSLWNSTLKFNITQFKELYTLTQLDTKISALCKTDIQCGVPMEQVLLNSVFSVYKHDENINRAFEHLMKAMDVFTTDTNLQKYIVCHQHQFEKLLSKGKTFWFQFMTYLSTRHEITHLSFNDSQIKVCQIINELFANQLKLLNSNQVVKQLYKFITHYP